MYELVVVWENGEKNIYTYETTQQARKAGFGMKRALGGQIAWVVVRRKEK